MTLPSSSISLSTLPLAAGKQAALNHSDILALLNAYQVAANAGAPVATDAVTLAFAEALFSFFANRLALMDEVRQAVATAYATPGAPDTASELDEYGNASAELVNNGKAATPTV